MAYKLELPVSSQIHSAFHVSCLKKIDDQAITQSGLPPTGDDGKIQLEPMAVLDRWVINKRNQAITQVLVHWFNSYPRDATCEDWFKIQNRYPSFKP